MKSVYRYAAILAWIALIPGCTNITLLRTAELRQVQARVDTLGVRLFATQKELARQQKAQSELLRVIRADMQVRFSELSQRVAAVEGGVHESQARLTDIDRKYLRFGQQLDAQLLNQGFYRRTIEETFDIGWKLLGLLPKSELTRIKRETVDAHYVEATE